MTAVLGLRLPLSVDFGNADSSTRLQIAIEYKCNWEQELERRARLGVTGPEPLPHPDDIVIDMKTDRVIIKGPMTKEEKAEWDRMYARGRGMRPRDRGTHGHARRPR